MPTFPLKFKSNFLHYAWRRLRDVWNFGLWRLGLKRGGTPHLVKIRAVREAARLLGAKTFVETGTYLGDMVAAVSSSFEQIFSIELSGELYRFACRRFEADKRIHLLNGDSGEMLERILPSLQEPAVFWLDAHYSGGITAQGRSDTPIKKELAAIFASQLRNFAVLIDDAFQFNGQNDYPAVRDLELLLGQKAPLFNVSIKHQIIFILPRTKGGKF